jgi:hypothetical protein
MNTTTTLATEALYFAPSCSATETGAELTNALLELYSSTDDSAAYALRAVRKAFSAYCLNVFGILYTKDIKHSGDTNLVNLAMILS